MTERNSSDSARMSSQTPLRLSVTVLSPDGEVSLRREFDPRESISVGRASESDIALKEFGTRVSRCHAVLLFDGREWEYYNLGVNGTFVDGQKTETLVIDGKVVLRLGKRGPILRLETIPVPTGGDSVHDDSDDEVTAWIIRVRDGDEDAARNLWEHYCDQISEVARRTMKRSSRRIYDEEDVAVESFKHLLAGIRSGRFTELERREQLWRLLMVITSRKAAAMVESDLRQKRGGGEVRGDSAVLGDGEMEEGPTEDDDRVPILKEEPEGFDRLTSGTAGPDIPALVADETENLLASLPDTTAEQIVRLKLQGYTHEEIAEQLECNVRTVERRLKQIRELWQRKVDALD